MTFAEFEDDYTDRANDILAARQNDYQLRLHDWLNVIDDSEYSRSVVAEIEELIDFAPWYRKLKASQHPNAPIDWAQDRSIRLAQQLGLVREFAAQGAGSYGTFALQFLNSRAAVADTIERVNSSIFEPLSRELLKHIRRQQPTITQPSPPHVDQFMPTTVVVLDHNAPAYRTLMGRLTDVVETLEKSNSARSIGEDAVERNLAELKAGMALLLKRTARPHIVQALLIASLTFSLQLIGNVTGEAMVKDALRQLQKVLGISIPGAD